MGELKAPRAGLREIRVLQVLSNLGIGGAEVWLIALLRHFRECAEQLGVRVLSDVFLTCGLEDELDEEAKNLGARLIYARYSRRTLPSFIATWRKTLRDGDCSAIHDHQEFSAGWHFLFGGGRLPPVRIAHLHNPMGHQESYGSGIIRRQTIVLGNCLIARIASHLLSTSRQLITEQGFDDLAAAKHLKKETVHCGFDARQFSCNRALAHEEVRREFNLPSEVKIMLFVGRLDSSEDESKNQKNPRFVLEVAKVCCERDFRFACILAGGGDAMLLRLKQRVRKWELQERILLVGDRSDIPRLMAGADCLLMPSFGEGLGMVAVEAQAAGLPVIASNAVPRECQVVNGAVRFLPLCEGKDAWADAVLIGIGEFSLDHSSANRKVMESQFSIEHSAKRLAEMYSGDA